MPTDAECFAKDRILSAGPLYAATSRARIEIVPYSTVDFVVARLVARAKETLKSATSDLSLIVQSNASGNYSLAPGARSVLRLLSTEICYV